MILLKKASALSAYLEKATANGAVIGFVPTMGALHTGHISLIQQSRKENSLTVCSIFVNPTQFNNPDDLEKYPITIEKDIVQLEWAGCDVLFLPSKDEMYVPGSNARHYQLGYLENILEGKYRPGHFQGVCQAVHRLLVIVSPDKFYLGQKDYQQCMVVAKLIEITGLNTQLIICPTLRETDGLAMSSRNTRLDPEQRKTATTIFKTLTYINKHATPGSLAGVKTEAVKMLADEGFKVDYVEIADAADLEIQNDWNGSQKIVILVAAYLGDIRLIDNMALN